MPKWISCALGALTALTVLVFAPAPASAFRFDPISRVFDPSGSGATQTFRVHNTSSRAIAVEVSVTTLSRDVDYGESNRPADDDFLVYPSQMIVAPGARQTVRVTWLGDPNPSSELSYRLVAEELPIELLESGAPSADQQPSGRVRILMTYRGSLYIRPRKVRAQVAFESATLVTQTDGSSRVAVTMRNSGTRYAVLASCRGKLVASSTGATVELDPATLASMAKTKILAGGRRRYLLAWPSSLEVGPVRASIQCSISP